MQARNRISDRYELTYPVGRGGMGEVWAGYDEKLDRPVAIKFLRHLDVPEHERETAVKRFRREARVTARLDHPGVPTVHDLGVQGDDLYIVMQLVPGIMLADLIAEQGQLSVPWAASIAAQICSVLAAAHAASLVHRDLKPQNVMVTPNGSVKVLDFGVAALLGPIEASRLTTAGSTLGTPAYIAPEQAQDAAVGPRTDLYALGCVLFELLTGRVPYQGDNAPDMLRRHIREPVPVVTHHRADVPDDLAHLVFCLLAKDPEDRPASAADVYHLLVPFIEPADGPATVWPGDPPPSYRYPLGPLPSAPHASAPVAGAVPAQRPGQPELSADELADIQDRARELAENERFTQAAELLRGALRSLGASDPPDLKVLKLRLEVADLQVLAGAYREAFAEFVHLTGAFAHGPDAVPELISHCRDQAMVCQVELGESFEELDASGCAAQRVVQGSEEPRA